MGQFKLTKKQELELEVAYIENRPIAPVCRKLGLKPSKGHYYLRKLTGLRLDNDEPIKKPERHLRQGKITYRLPRAHD